MRRTNRRKRRLYVTLFIVAVSATYAAIALYAAVTIIERPLHHNIFGGYIPACGDLPPLLGDDC